jgi:hypothetical protein
LQIKTIGAKPGIIPIRKVNAIIAGIIGVTIIFANIPMIEKAPKE